MGFFQPVAPGGSEREFWDYVTNGYDGKPYAPAGYLRNSDVFTAVKTVAQDVATNPLKLMQDQDNVMPGDLEYLLNVKPNDLMDAWHFKYIMAANMLLCGNAYARIVKTKKDFVELDLLKPSWVTIYKNPLKYEIYDDDGNHYWLQPEEILHYMYASRDGYVGISPLYSLSDEIRMENNGNRMMGDYLNSGQLTRGALKISKSDLSTEAMTALRNKFVEANGPTNKTGVTVIPSEMEYQDIQIDTSILKLVNSNNYSTRQIAKAFSIPTYKLGIEGSHTSIEQANLDYIQNSLDHYFSAINAENNIKLLPRNKAGTQRFEFDVSRLLRLDTKTNIEESIKMYQNGGIDHDEYRRRLGYKPASDTSDFVVMSNYVPLDKIPITTLKGGNANGTENGNEGSEPEAGDQK